MNPPHFYRGAGDAGAVGQGHLSACAHFGWVLGWAIPLEWFRPLVEAAFPAVRHTLVPPTPHAWEDLESGGRPFDRVWGYSLGSQLLLAEPRRAAALGPVSLLAPIWTFPAEAGQGGRVPRTNLRALRRAFRLNPAEALTQFYAAAQLDIAPAPAAVAAGEWGLEQLAHVALSPQLPDGWQAWCGDDDALLDAARLQCLVPQLNRVPGATHHPRALLAAAAALR
jgi:hypothetical protein